MHRLDLRSQQTGKALHQMFHHARTCKFARLGVSRASQGDTWTRIVSATAQTA